MIIRTCGRVTSFSLNLALSVVFPLKITVHDPHPIKQPSNDRMGRVNLAKGIHFHTLWSLITPQRSTDSTMYHTLQLISSDGSILHTGDLLLDNKYCANFRQSTTSYFSLIRKARLFEYIHSVNTDHFAT
mmetsp:Transcript_10390/g.22571  ORF Transcript_10390/g.22571 Transcript_10390/m.22571 type:complete len:130 (+) Transcript_10390:309-698(+)